jgi:5-methylcytosine-specific restriction endonuclease McrA
VDRKAELRETTLRHSRRTLQVYQSEDGMVIVRGRLTPEAGAVLMKALAAARETLYEQRQMTSLEQQQPAFERQQADALALLAESALQHGIDPGTAGERYQVVVHVDAPVLADADAPGQSVLEDGALVSAETSQRLACDASRVVMRHDNTGRLVEIGARTRTIPPALRRALHHRDRSCCFPGCGVRFGQGHHLRHWAHGGPTTLSNLALLCRRHHRAVHEEGYQVARGPDGTLRFRRPDGRPLPEVPSPAAVPKEPVEALCMVHESQGLCLNARTACAGWLGERLDVGWAIDVLHPLAQEARPWPPSE